ncbi:ATP-binding response regulator [Halorussus salinus]|uniref:ATP-binding response regulator n=1 Tax=Halorussus salinus TaxID=1364935 RepID=UPI001092DD91|nr:response regulator [Halorussus salinus]
MTAGHEDAGLSVLYVDDDEHLRELGRTFLERADDGLTVETVPTAAAALERLDAGDYDAVVSDYRMPETDGLELLETVREERDSDVPFVMFTGRGREEVAMDALNLGADRYVQKGGDPDSQYDVLANSVRQAVEYRRAEAARRENERRYRSLFESNPMVFWVEDFSGVKARLDETAGDVDDLEAYLDRNAAEASRLLDEVRIIDVNENALEYYGAASKRELVENMDALFTDESFEAYKSLMATVARGETHFRTESVMKTLDGERKHELMEVNVPDEYADDYSRVYVTITDITDRVRVTNREAFLHSLLRHDVRNKEQVVHGNLQRLAELDLPDEATDYVATATETVEESIDIIEKVGTLLRAEEGEATELVALRPAVRSAVESHAARAEARGIGLDVTGDAPRVEAGPLVEELFDNLVANAVEHADADRIRVELADRPDGAVVTVADDGDGLPTDDPEEVLERGFTAGSNAGAGLGLHLVATVAESYGGRIEVGESDLGGARFDVYL